MDTQQQAELDVLWDTTLELAKVWRTLAPSWFTLAATYRRELGEDVNEALREVELLRHAVERQNKHPQN